MGNDRPPIVLLATDLDGTLIPYEVDARQLRALERFRQLFARRTPGQGRPWLAYVTGRHLALAEEGIRQWGLPPPDLLVCDVGTALYRRSAAGWRRDADYEARLAHSWPGSQAVAAVLDPLAGIEPQEPERQGPLKRSYYVPLANRAALLAAEEALARAGITAKLVFSVDHRQNVGLLDVLPPAAAKDAALSFLAAEQNAPIEQVVYAGDSGNDIDALTSGCRGIVVGNADQQLRQELNRRSQASGRLYFSRWPYTAGVMEGCDYFKIDGIAKNAIPSSVTLLTH